MGSAVKYNPDKNAIVADVTAGGLGLDKYRGVVSDVASVAVGETCVIVSAIALIEGGVRALAQKHQAAITITEQPRQVDFFCVPLLVRALQSATAQGCTYEERLFERPLRVTYGARRRRHFWVNHLCAPRDSTSTGDRRPSLLNRRLRSVAHSCR